MTTCRCKDGGGWLPQFKMQGRVRLMVDVAGATPAPNHGPRHSGRLVAGSPVTAPRTVGHTSDRPSRTLPPTAWPAALVPITLDQWSNDDSGSNLETHESLPRMLRWAKAAKAAAQPISNAGP